MATTTLQIKVYAPRHERCRCGATGQMFNVAGQRRCWACTMALLDTSIPADYEVTIQERNERQDNTAARLYQEM